MPTSTFLDQHPQPDGTPSYPGSREPFQYNSTTQVHCRPTHPDLALSARARTPDSPPALVQAVAPWIIATNLEVGQVYGDDERTPIARPFDTSPAARSTSYPVPTGRFLDDGLQTPLGKYDCKFCGKLFNRPSSLRVRPPRVVTVIIKLTSRNRYISTAIQAKNVSELEAEQPRILR